MTSDTFRKYNILSTVPLRVLSNLQYNEIYFKPGMVIQIGEYDDNIPLFGLIIHICCFDDSFFLCVQRLLTHGFDSHYHAFRVEYENVFLSVNVLYSESNYTGYICTSKEDCFYIN